MPKKDEKFTRPTDIFKSDMDKRWKVPKKDLVALPEAKKYKKSNIDFARLGHMISAQAEKLNDVEGIIELLPDLRIIEEILVSNILSPKDLKEVNLQIAVHRNAPPEIAELIRVHFSTVFDLNSRLSSILSDALFMKGSVIFLPLPVNSIRNIIAAGTYGLESIENTIEAFYNFDDIKLGNIGLIGKKGVPSSGNFYALESFELTVINEEDNTKGDTVTIPSDLVELSDNALFLAKPAIRKEANKNRAKKAINSAYGLEDLYDENPTAKGYINRAVKYLPSDQLVAPESFQKSEFDPIVIEIPAESCIPVHRPGSPKDHVGYWIFQDLDGNPISCVNPTNKFKELNSKLKNSVNQQAFTTTLQVGASYISNGNSSVGYSDDKNNNQTLIKAYYDNFEQKLIDAIANGSSKQKVEISNPGELYRIMLARQYAKQKTRVVYVPAEMVSYIAFNYNSQGIGESLIEKTKLYSSIRATLMFASVLAAIKSSVNRREVTITVDPDEPDPNAAIEEMLNEYMSLQASQSPLGRLNPIDIVDSLQRMGVQTKINGGDRYPSTDMAVNESKQDVSQPAEDLLNMFRDIHYRALWVEPDVAINSTNVDFASVGKSNNVLQTKRYMSVQKDYIAELNDFIKKYISMGGPLLTDIQKSYSKLKDKNSITFSELIDSITVVLPKADNAVITAQTEEYGAYCTFIENATNAYVSDEMMKDLFKGENIGPSLDDVKTAALNLLKRNFLRSNNMLPELDALFNLEDSNVADVLENHIDTVAKLVTDILKFTTKVEDSKDKEIAELKAQLNPPEETPTGDSTAEPQLDENGNPIESTDNVDDTGETTDLDNPDDNTDLDNTEEPTDADTDTEVTDDDLETPVDADETEVPDDTSKDKKKKDKDEVEDIPEDLDVDDTSTKKDKSKKSKEEPEVDTDEEDDKDLDESEDKLEGESDDDHKSRQEKVKKKKEKKDNKKASLDDLDKI